jgi:hypothetical protein
MGMEQNLPLANWFAVTCGPIAFPLFGIVAAAAFIIADVLFRNRWMQWALIAVFALLILWGFRGLIFGGVFMVPNTRANFSVERMATGGASFQIRALADRRHRSPLREADTRMKKPKRVFWLWALIQFCVVLSLLVVVWYPGAANCIAHPTHVDAYFDYTWSFQIMVFGIFWFLPMLVVFGLLLLVERFLIGFIARKRHTNEQESA